jgi:UDP-N-acetylglucosamine 2-epimerase (non-hydrolysing)
MKVLTILGTRPEIIRLSRVIPLLDQLCDHVLVHTGQNYDPGLSEIFFDELAVRQPDHQLGIRAASFGEQVGQIIAASEQLLRRERPERLLVLGDTNSGLAALVAKRLGIPVYHLEAGNRCFDDAVPEEVNRRVIDHCSDVLLPYTERSRQNLLREGLAGERIYVVGNPIGEVLAAAEPQIAASTVLDRLGLAPERYFLATFHRQENVDREPRLRRLVEALQTLTAEYGLPLVCSVHPRTADRLAAFGLDTSSTGLILAPPFGFFDFLALERQAHCVLSDSGTVQEECCLLGVANVTLRDVTERPETLECGSNMLSGVEPADLLRCVRTVLSQRRDWTTPPDYRRPNVSATIARLVLGYRPPLAGPGRVG